MKKIIDGKRYDTSTARHLGSYRTDLSASDSGYYTEDLYVKRTGEFFLYGDGEARSPYHHFDELGGQVGAEDIVPLTYAEAKEWVENYLDADKYEHLFGTASESGPTVQIGVNISKAAAEKLQMLVTERNMSRNILLEQLIMSA